MIPADLSLMFGSQVQFLQLYDCIPCKTTAQTIKVVRNVYFVYLKNNDVITYDVTIDAYDLSYNWQPISSA
jgi:hypothetical protein